MYDVSTSLLNMDDKFYFELEERSFEYLNKLYWIYNSLHSLILNIIFFLNLGDVVSPHYIEEKNYFQLTFFLV